MRPIKFRGKRVDNGEWVYGFLIVENNRSYIHVDEDSWGKTTFGVHTYLIEVIPETVGQFTGLTDKNGKEIYEGDIVKNKFRERYQTLVCYWNEINNGFSFRDQFDGYDRSLTSCEVIGNIHDNPELLK